jgi:hypothetical protein
LKEPGELEGTGQTIIAKVPAKRTTVFPRPFRQRAQQTRQHKTLDWAKRNIAPNDSIIDFSMMASTYYHLDSSLDTECLVSTSTNYQEPPTREQERLVVDTNDESLSQEDDSKSLFSSTRNCFSLLFSGFGIGAVVEWLTLYSKRDVGRTFHYAILAAYFVFLTNRLSTGKLIQRTHLILTPCFMTGVMNGSLLILGHTCCLLGVMHLIVVNTLVCLAVYVLTEQFESWIRASVCDGNHHIGDNGSNDFDIDDSFAYASVV